MSYLSCHIFLKSETIHFVQAWTRARAGSSKSAPFRLNCGVTLNLQSPIWDWCSTTKPPLGQTRNQLFCSSHSCVFACVSRSGRALSFTSVHNGRSNNQQSIPAIPPSSGLPVRPHASTHPASLTAPSGIFSISLIAATQALQAPGAAEAGGQPLFIHLLLCTSSSQRICTKTHTHTRTHVCTHTHVRTYAHTHTHTKWEPNGNMLIGLAFHKRQIWLCTIVLVLRHTRARTHKYAKKQEKVGVDEGGEHALSVAFTLFFILGADSFTLSLSSMFCVVAQFYDTLQYDLV